MTLTESSFDLQIDLISIKEDKGYTNERLSPLAPTGCGGAFLYMTNKNSLDGWKIFLKVLQSKLLAKEPEALFDLFFTPEELENLKGRSLIIKALLEEKMTQREMAETFHVSISQITRGSNALKRLSPSLLSELKKTI